jgi:hypothetical protein
LSPRCWLQQRPSLLPTGAVELGTGCVDAAAVRGSLLIERTPVHSYPPRRLTASSFVQARELDSAAFYTNLYHPFLSPEALISGAATDGSDVLGGSTDGFSAQGWAPPDPAPHDGYLVLPQDGM